MSPSPQRGFTLIEVLAVVFLTTILFSAAVTYYVELSTRSTEAAETTRQWHHATALVDRVAADLERSYLVAKPAELDPLEHPWLFLAESRYAEGGSDQLKFTARRAVDVASEGPRSDLSFVAYMLRTQADFDDAYELLRWSEPGLPEALERELPNPDDAQLMADGIASFRLRFLDAAGGWHERWDSSQLEHTGTLPIAAEIEVAFAPPVGAETSRVPPIRRRVAFPLARHRPRDAHRPRGLRVRRRGRGRGWREQRGRRAPRLRVRRPERPGCQWHGARPDPGRPGERPANRRSALRHSLVVRQAVHRQPQSPGDPVSLRPQREQGMILMIVLVFALLLTAAVATFTRRAMVDTAIARNRDYRAQAEALARGGIELGKALLLEDKLGSEENGKLDTHDDLWAQIGQQPPIELENGGRLRIQIEDTSTRLNLNAVIGGQGEDGQPNPKAETLLADVLEKIIDEMPIPPGEKVYDQSELVVNLIDFVDKDDERLSGGREEDAYDRRGDVAGPPNRPLLSVDELRRIEGFDAKLVDAMRPYVTVYPYAGSTGVNLNTAPPHVLALLYFDDGVELNLAKEDTVRQILRARQEGNFLCGESQSSENCTPIGEIVTNEIFPPPAYESHVFTILAEAQVGEVTRSIEAVVDRKQAPDLVLLSWQVL